jgi:CRISPR/Cas system-associated protein Cas10 (large subunit of type III CRISPR-Cas system)
MANALINRAKNLQEFTVEVEVPEDFRFNGLIPFDMTINEGMISAKVFALDFDEAVKRLDDFLEGQK